jgi:hypothetical protein
VGSGRRTWPWRPVGSAVRKVSGGDQATTAWLRACTRAGRDTLPWAVVGRWQAGPFNLIFSLNFKISTNLKFTTKVFLMLKNTQTLHSHSWNIRDNFPFWNSFKFPQCFKLQILEQVQI